MNAKEKSLLFYSQRQKTFIFFFNIKTTTEREIKKINKTAKQTKYLQQTLSCNNYNNNNNNNINNIKQQQLLRYNKTFCHNKHDQLRTECGTCEYLKIDRNG